MNYSGVEDIAIARIIRIFYFVFLSDTKMNDKCFKTST